MAGPSQEGGPWSRPPGCPHLDRPAVSLPPEDGDVLVPVTPLTPCEDKQPMSTGVEGHPVPPPGRQAGGNTATLLPQGRGRQMEHQTSERVCRLGTPRPLPWCPHWWGCCGEPAGTPRNILDTPGHPEVSLLSSLPWRHSLAQYRVSEWSLGGLK